MSFNSIKVRLKRKLAGFDASFNDLFQFHKGPIKANFDNWKNIFGNLVSIP